MRRWRLIAARRLSTALTLTAAMVAGCSEPTRDPNESLIPTQPAAVKPSGTVEERIKAAEEAAAQKDYAKAIKPLEDAILIDAKDRRVLALLARYGAAHARDIAKTDPGQAYKQIVSAGVYLRMLQREHPDATPEEKQLLLDVLYDEAAAHAKSMRMEETLGALREAVGAGFRDFDKIRGDADWKEMLEYPEFKKEFDEIAKTQKPS